MFFDTLEATINLKQIDAIYESLKQHHILIYGIVILDIDGESCYIRDRITITNIEIFEVFDPLATSFEDEYVTFLKFHIIQC